MTSGVDTQPGHSHFQLQSISPFAQCQKTTRTLVRNNNNMTRPFSFNSNGASRDGHCACIEEAEATASTNKGQALTKIYGKHPWYVRSQFGIFMVFFWHIPAVAVRQISLTEPRFSPREGHFLHNKRHAPSMFLSKHRYIVVFNIIQWRNVAWTALRTLYFLNKTGDVWEM